MSWKSMQEDEELSEKKRRGVIGWRTATVLYLVLVAFAFWTLRGKMLALGLVIVGGIAAKSYLGWWRDGRE